MNSSSEPAPLLYVHSLCAGYGNKRVLNKVELQMRAGEIIALIGHNGAGKSTLLKAIYGLIPLFAGSVSFDQNTSGSTNSASLRRAGLVYVPQGNRTLEDLTVLENLEIGGLQLSKISAEAGVQRALAMFPKLSTRLKQRAGTLSGGEKQMLAMATAFIVNPRALLLDEPSTALAPAIAGATFQFIRAQARNNGLAALIAEQKVHEVLKIADRVYVLRNGSISYQGSVAELHDEAKLREVYL